MVTAYVFPGQGSQKLGMGAELFDAFPALVEQADHILGWSVRALCLDDPRGELGLTQFTQPALYVVNALTWFAARRDGHALPDYLAGHSLGEYNALLAADVFDFETGLRLVRKRGELMSQARDGGMAAVVGLPAETLHEVLRREGADDIDIANFNSPSQTVISGPVDLIERLCPLFEAAGARRALKLKVSAAFHSRYMEKPAAEFAAFLKGWRFQAPKIPVIANVNARPYGHDVYSNLARQIRGSVHWNDSMRYLLGAGVTEIQEIGPGKVLTNLFREIKRTGTPLDLNNLPPAPEVAPLPELSEPAVAVDDTPRNAWGGPQHNETVTDTDRNAWGGNQNVKSPANPWRGADSAPVAAVPLPPNPPAPLAMTPPPNAPHVPSPVAPPTQPTTQAPPAERAETLGSDVFRRTYGVRLAYYSGSMYKGIASRELVARMAGAGLLGFMGTGGLSLERVEQDLRWLKQQIPNGVAFGMNMLANYEDGDAEIELARRYLDHAVPVVEASAFMQVTPGLVLFRYKGAGRDAQGRPIVRQHLIAKVSRPEVAKSFMSPAPERALKTLLQRGLLTEAEAEIARVLPVASDITIEADSGGHTDRGNPYTLMPAIIALRDSIQAERGYPTQIRIGAAGGIGAPSSAAAAFMLGADYIVTGSINQCTPEAGTSDAVKDLLAGLNVQDTDYAPAGDLFEVGAKVQVVKRGLFFAARANKLYELYRRHSGLADLDQATRDMIENKYFKRSIEEVWAETRAYLERHRPHDLAKAESNPKQKMALVFKWYFVHTTRLAMNGDQDQRVDYQVHCGPAMGAFNQVVKGTALENRHNRHVDAVAHFIMNGAADLVNQFTHRR